MEQMMVRLLAEIKTEITINQAKNGRRSKRNGRRNGGMAKSHDTEPRKADANLKEIMAGQQHSKEEILTNMESNKGCMDAKIDANQEKWKPGYRPIKRCMRSFKVLLSHRWIYTKPGQCHLKKN
jgi:hypothetical protein